MNRWILFLGILWLVTVTALGQDNSSTTERIKMPVINSEFLDFAPTISADGRTLYLNRTRRLRLGIIPIQD